MVRRRTHKSTHVEEGPGLARGPALILGAILTGFGLAMFLRNGATPTGGFSNGDIDGPTFLGFETNGWTAWITTAAGALLLFGAAQHLLAKMMSLLVGGALAACVVLAALDGSDVLGLAATNFWTLLGWGIAAGLLLVNTLMPRVRHRDRDRDRDVVVDRDRDWDRRDDTATTSPPAAPVTAPTGRFQRDGEGLHDPDLDRDADRRPARSRNPLSRR